MSGKLSLMDSLGNHTTSASPRTLLVSLIQVVKVFEHIVGDIPNRSARSSFNTAKRNLIRVSNFSSLCDKFLFFLVVSIFRFTFLDVTVLFVPLQYINFGKNGDKSVKRTLNSAIEDHIPYVVMGLDEQQ